MVSPVVIREAKWAGGVVLGLLLTAALTPVGSFLLRYGWFRGWFRIPTEEVLIPLAAALLSAPIVAATMLVTWLAIGLLPGLASRLSSLLFLQVAVVAGVWTGAALAGWSAAWVLPPAALVVLLPRLALARNQVPDRRVAQSEPGG